MHSLRPLRYSVLVLLSVGPFACGGDNSSPHRDSGTDAPVDSPVDHAGGGGNGGVGGGGGSSGDASDGNGDHFDAGGGLDLTDVTPPPMLTVSVLDRRATLFELL